MVVRHVIVVFCMRPWSMIRIDIKRRAFVSYTLPFCLEKWYLSSLVKCYYLSSSVTENFPHFSHFFVEPYLACRSFKKHLKRQQHLISQK